MIAASVLQEPSAAAVVPAGTASPSIVGRRTHASFVSAGHDAGVASASCKFSKMKTERRMTMNKPKIALVGNGNVGTAIQKGA